MPDVGPVYNVSLEKVLACQPDLVIASADHHAKLAAQLEESHIPVLVLKTKTYDDVKRNLDIIGKVYGKEDAAKAKEAELDQAVQAIADAVPAQGKRVAIIHATPSSVSVELPSSIAGDMAQLLHLQNIAADAATDGQTTRIPYSMESLVQADPDVIFLTSMGSSDKIEKRIQEDIKGNPAWASLSAVKAGRVYVLPENISSSIRAWTIRKPSPIWPIWSIRRPFMNSVASRHRTLWRWLVLGAFAVLALAGLILSILQGVAAITPTDVIHILWQPSVRTADQIIWNIRLPRTLTGALVGANLALSGAILQAVMRNPLADPHIIGISSGAGLAGIVVLIVWPAYLFWMTPAAFLGAMAAAVLIYLLAWKDGIRPVRIILAGVAVSAFLGAIISGILIFTVTASTEPCCGWSAAWLLATGKT